MMRLTKRERLLTIISVAVITILVFFTIAIKPALARLHTLKRVIPEKKHELQELQAKSREYLSLRQGVQNLHEKIEAQDEPFGLLPFLESLIQEQGLSAKVILMKQQILELDSDSSNTIVELELENLTLSELVNFLKQIQSSKVIIRFASLHITKNQINPNLLNFSAEINSPMILQDGL